MNIPTTVKSIIVSTVDSNLVSLIAAEYLISSLSGELFEELYDAGLLPIAAAEPTYGLYVFKSAPELGLILRRSQIRFGNRKKYFSSLLQEHPNVKFVGIGSLPIYLKPSSVLQKGSDSGTIDRYGFESFVVYCENGDLEETARHLTLLFLTYIGTLGIDNLEKDTLDSAIKRLPRLKEFSAK